LRVSRRAERRLGLVEGIGHGREALGKVAAGEPVAILREVFGSPLTDPDSGRSTVTLLRSG
jgi:hypothetical protein